MDLTWLVYTILTVGILVLFYAYVVEETVMALMGILVIAMGFALAFQRAQDNSRHNKEVQAALISRGYPRPSMVDGNAVRWSASACQLTFKLIKLNSNWGVLIEHPNGTVTALKPSQLKDLLSNPVCL